MRILQLGDTHLGIQRRAWRPPDGWSRDQDHLAAFERALAPALREEVDLVVHTGDLFDRSRPPPAAVAAARTLLARVARRVPVVVLAGNHDRRGLQGHLGVTTPGLAVVDDPCQVDVARLRLALVPHRREAAAWRQAAAGAVGGGVDLLITHQGVRGVQVPGFTFQPGRPAETLDHLDVPAGIGVAILSGHLHPHQVVEVGGVPVVYAGSTERTSFSERDQTKGTVLWDLGGRAPSWRFVELPSRPMVHLRGGDDLDAIEPGTYVGMSPRLLPTWAEPALRRGGIIALPLPATSRGPGRQQVRLF